MALKPTFFETIGRKFVFPFTTATSMKLRQLNRPISPSPVVPLQVSPKIIKTIAENVDNTTFAANVSAKAAAQNLLNSFVVRDGKPYIRITGSTINTLRPFKGETVEKFLQKYQGTQREEAKKILDVINKQFYGKELGAKDILVDKFMNQNIGAAQSHIVMGGLASKLVDVPMTAPVVITPPLGTPSSINTATGQITLTNPTILTAFHEMSHLKDYKNPISKAIPFAGKAIQNMALVGTPVSILYGDKIAESIPGKADDALIKAFKYFGPEIYLAGAGLMHYPERFAAMNTKKIIDKNNTLFGEFGKKFNMTPDDLKKIQDLNFRTYPGGVLGTYGTMRLGTIPLYMLKESALKIEKVTAKDYVDIAKNLRQSLTKSLIGLKEGVTDKNVLSALLHHDSAVKYAPIPHVMPASILASTIPLLLLSSYYNDKKEPPVFPQQRAQILKGLGA